MLMNQYSVLNWYTNLIASHPSRYDRPYAKRLRWKSNAELSRKSEVDGRLWYPGDASRRHSTRICTYFHSRGSVPIRQYCRKCQSPWRNVERGRSKSLLCNAEDEFRKTFLPVGAFHVSIAAGTQSPPPKTTNQHTFFLLNSITEITCSRFSRLIWRATYARYTKKFLSNFKDIS